MKPSASALRYQRRREALLRRYPQTAFLVATAPVLIRNGDVAHPYRQNSNFFYLTGIEEPQALLLFFKDGRVSRSVMWLPDRDPVRELWDGKMLGHRGAKQSFGIDEVYAYTDLEKQLPSYLSRHDRLAYALGGHEAMDALVLKTLKQCKRGRRVFVPDLIDAGALIGEQRLFKETEEIAVLREAGQVSARAHRTLMSRARPGMKEYELEALFYYEIRRNGCQRLGYESIVAAGSHATVLHYRENSGSLKAGDLVLVDAGAEKNYYTADISRTFPVGAAFTPLQADLYDCVLEAQAQAIRLVKPGQTLERLHAKTCEILTRGLLDLKILKGSVAENLEKKHYQAFYPHQTSHYLGMDVHDVSGTSAHPLKRKLEAGMVFTIEPGLYFSPSRKDLPQGCSGLGIRIEDDILVTPRGCEVLTRDVPKDRAAIEELRQEAL